MTTIDPAFRERYLRRRNTPLGAAKLARKHKLATDAERRRRRASAVLDVSLLDGDWDAAVAISGMTSASLAAWLRRYTGSRVWPLSGDQQAKLAYLAEKHN